MIRGVAALLQYNTEYKALKDEVLSCVFEWRGIIAHGRHEN